MVGSRDAFCEYASPKRIRITHDAHLESFFLFSMISVNTHHAYVESWIFAVNHLQPFNLAGCGEVTKSVAKLPVPKLPCGEVTRIHTVLWLWQYALPSYNRPKPIIRIQLTFSCGGVMRPLTFHAYQ